MNGQLGHYASLPAVMASAFEDTAHTEILLRNRAATTLDDAERRRILHNDMAFGRAGTPEEIGAAVAFLASTRSAYTSGTVLTIDGGKK